MYYIALLEAYKEAEEADSCPGYLQALQILIVREGAVLQLTSNQ